MLLRKILCTLFAFSLSLPYTLNAEASLKEQFKNPPQKSRPHTWWHWMAGHVTKEGITKDLEAMKQIGLGGYQAFQIRIDTPLGPVRYGSPEWFEMIDHSMAESHRLGLEFGFHNCAGWSSTGGTWITPKDSMKRVVWTETKLKPSQLNDLVALPQPEAVRNYYEDITIIAYPTPLNETKGEEPYKLDNWLQKGFHHPHAKLTITPQRLFWDERPAPENVTIDPSGVIILQAQTDEDELFIDTADLAKDRDWTILRFGMTTNGMQNSPAIADGGGLEIDKMSRASVDVHWENLMEPIYKISQKYPGTYTNVLIDSFEKGYSNWTEGFEKEFMKRRGYDCRLWFPAMTGRIIASKDQTERFLWDLRQTIGELINENYFRYFKEKANAQGLELALEPYGMGNFDEFGAALESDIPMGEFWTREDRKVMRDSTAILASSAANLLGKSKVGAEAFTSHGRTVYTNTPKTLKAPTDRMLANGINHFIFHTYMHQPWGDEIKPGMNMGRFGFNFNRNNTWFSKGRPFIDYLTRCQLMGQSSQKVIDLLYIYGENTPASSKSTPELLPALPEGYKYHKSGYQALSLAAVNESGEIAFASGARYQAIVVTDAERMRPAMLAELSRLASAGGTIFMDLPQTSPSLENYPLADETIKRLSEKLMNRENVLPLRSYTGETLVKRGILPDFETVGNLPLVYHHGYVEDLHWYYISNVSNAPLSCSATFRMPEGPQEFWDPTTGSSHNAIIWARTADGRVNVQLDLDAGESQFILFDTSQSNPAPPPAIASIQLLAEQELPFENMIELGLVEGEPSLLSSVETKVSIHKADQRTFNKVLPGSANSLIIDRPWTVSFGKWGPTEPVKFTQLPAWNEHDDAAIKYYSGTAKYENTFRWNNRITEIPIFLDLGEVYEICEITLNGKDLGLLWTPPYKLNIAPYLKMGTNTLTLQVTSNQVNRLIGDAQHEETEVGNRAKNATNLNAVGSLIEIPKWVEANKPNPNPDRVTFSTFPHWKKDAKLYSSGLVGPVKIVTPSVTKLTDLE